MDVVIYHNPGCGTSRNVLALIRNAGIEPHVIGRRIDRGIDQRIRELARAENLLIVEVLEMALDAYESQLQGRR